MALRKNMANRVSYLKISTPFEKIFCGDAKERKREQKAEGERR